ncbi:unnamed protein product [Toxocara canis]|uniref:Conserved oligomeric Golgi complex subunit 7 n=1 Tax=Toxocara canis TaxID=6265 RepID=A0A183V9G9_TOXCA|nr:unnamed protein product [Toxocara canis]
MTILTTVLELIADILRSLLSNICHHVFQINLDAGSSHAIDSASRLLRTPLSKSEQRVVFEEIRRIALELTTKEINDLGPAVEEFFPYLTFEEILAIKHSELTPSSPSSSWLERLLNVSDSTLQQPSPGEFILVVFCVHSCFLLSDQISALYFAD